MYTNLAIAVFGYSRPRHLIQLLDSIELNSEVDLIKLYIFIDGEKVDKNTREVSNCFQIAQEFASRHSNTEIYKHQKNLGLSNSIRFGIDYIFERHNEVIVLEDDLVCSEFFLDFCIQGLNRFRDEHRVASIHGYLPPLIKKFDEPQFLKGTDCWGWATWKDRWKSVEWDARELVQKIGQGEIEHQFNLEEKFPFSRMLKEQADGKIDSWAIRWHANMFLQSRLTLYPNISLINNTGFDNSGTHGKKSNDYSTTISEVKIEIPANLEIVENATFRESVGDFYFSIINRREPIKYRLRKTLSLIIKTVISIKPAKRA
jgi:hypothetical protein